MTTNNFRQYAEDQSDLAAHEAYLSGKRPLPHVGHDPRFLRMYDRRGNVTLTDLEDGTESPAFRVDYETAEQEAWMESQRQLRS